MMELPDEDELLQLQKGVDWADGEDVLEDVLEDFLGCEDFLPADGPGDPKMHGTAGKSPLLAPRNSFFSAGG